MSQGAIFTPVGVLAFWTFAVLLLIPFPRFRGALSGVSGGERPPAAEPLSVADRAIMNLLELPVLFYIVCLMFFVTTSVTDLIVELAWVYVGVRLAQTVVHLTYNNTLHRVTLFAISCFVLVMLWILFFFPVAGK